jgi:hypothetical protein
MNFFWLLTKILSVTKITRLGMRILLSPLIAAIIVASPGCKTPTRVLNLFQAQPILHEDTVKALQSKYTDWFSIAATVTNAPSDQWATRRNTVLNDLLILSDFKYEQFKTKLYVLDAGGNSIIDTTSIGLTAAATLLAGPVGQVLSGTDTALKGFQGKTTERWLNSKNIRVLLITMDSMRADVRSTLFSEMGKSYNDFTVQQGYDLINQYHRAASLVNALSHLESTMSNEKKSSEEAASNALKNRPLLPQ